MDDPQGWGYSRIYSPSEGMDCTRVYIDRCLGIVRRPRKQGKYYVFGWAKRGSNPGPHGCEPCALTN